MEIEVIKRQFDIIGDSKKIDFIISIAKKVAPTDLSVLITGESGVGKEKIPQIIHKLSSRKHNNYIAVNCGAIPEGTIDSELFGHEKGSFTGASEKRKGYFEEADRGTLFLDEVADLPLATQVRLLRVLETGEFIKVGSSKPQKVDVRIIAATNIDIRKRIENGKFREDLYYRLNTVPINMPPLRERKEDIEQLARKFISDFCTRQKVPNIKILDDGIEYLKGYDWPGNIRQLKNTIEQLCILEEKRELNGNDISKYIETNFKRSLPMKLELHNENNNINNEINLKLFFEIKSELYEIKKILIQLLNKEKLLENAIGFLPQNSELKPNNIDTNDYDIINENEENKNFKVIKEQEKELINKMLIKFNGRKKETANALGLSERTLYRKIKDYNLNF